MPTTTAAPKGKRTPAESVSLRDLTDQLLAVEALVHERADDILANDGELPADLAAALDAVSDQRDDKLRAYAALIRRFGDYADRCKAEAARYTQRRTIWEKTVAGLKRRALEALARYGTTRVDTADFTIYAQQNPPCVEITLDNDALLTLYDDSVACSQDGSLPAAPRLAEFVHVDRVAKVDTRALLAQYETDRAHWAIVAESEVTVDSLTADEWGCLSADEDTRRKQVDALLHHKREAAVAAMMAMEYPGVTITRGSHLRIR